MQLNANRSSNSIQKALCRLVMDSGELVGPRGMPTLEMLGVSFSLADPRNRLTTIEARRWSPALAVAELAWNVRGERSVDALAFYNERWRDFADSSGLIRGSCYGAKVFQDLGTGSQWQHAKRALQDDADTRRAVLSFRNELDVSAATNDLSCTNSMQFIARSGKLHAFVNMRSNDVIWGVPYDLFLFTCLQEQMAIELGLQLGVYHHYAASMHIYDRHFELARKVANDAGDDQSGLMPPIPDSEALARLSNAEAELRLFGLRNDVMQSPFEETCIGLLVGHPKYRALAA